MSAIEITACPLSLNKIIMDTLGGAMRKVLRECAEKINTNFDALASVDAEDRLETIIRMFGLEDEDTVKIIQPAKKKASDPKTPKAKAEKKIPVPLWCYVDAVDKNRVYTNKPELCQGLTAGLYSQCPAKPKDGSIYCAKCRKDADANDGMPKRGNVAMRIAQFNQSKYEYTPPNSKTVKKIYPFEWAIKNKFTEEEFDEMLRDNMILSNKGKELIKFVPERKTRTKKTKTLTEDMTEKKGKAKKSEPEEEEEEEDIDDCASVCSEYSTATHADEEEEDGIQFAEDEDEEVKPEPKPEPKKTETKKPKSALKAEVKYTAEIATYKSFKVGEERFACLRTVVYSDGEEFDIYGVRNYVGPKEFEVTVKPVGTFNPVTKERVLFE